MNGEHCTKREKGKNREIVNMTGFIVANDGVLPLSYPCFDVNPDKTGKVAAL